MIWLFGLAGATAGALQSRSIGRSLGRHHDPLATLLRLGLAAIVLFLAAKHGHVLACASGWAAGFLIVGLWVFRRLQ